MYPRLIDCRVRGSSGDYYLHQFLSGSEFVLNELQAQILNTCNGNIAVEEIRNRFGATKEDMGVFLNVLEQARLIDYRETPTGANPFPELTKPPYLREVHLDATGRCNLFGKCKHCYGQKDFIKSTMNELTLDDFERIITEMHDMNVASCVLSGGEVYVRKDLPRLIHLLGAADINISGIFTNGTIYREDVLDALNLLRMRSFFFVSLDGHCSETHDFMRGEGNFAATIDFITKVQRAGFRVIVNTVVIKQNVHDLYDMALMLEDIGINRWRLTVPREQGETVLNKDLIMPEWEDIFRAYDKLIRHALDKSGPMKMQIGSIFKSELLEEPVYYLFGASNSCCEYKRNTLVIKPDGRVTPCTAFDNMALGNIKEQDLREIWYAEKTQAMKTLPVSETDCKDCEILAYCGAGCRRIAWELHGSVLAKDDNSCPLYEFANSVTKPLLKKYGVMAEYLDEASPYPYEPKMLNGLVG